MFVSLLFGFSVALAPAVPGVKSAGNEAPAAVEPAAHRREVEVWQKARDARLRSDSGWLTLVALYWLHPGVNRFGAAADNDLVLPAGAPAHAGTLRVDAGKVTVELAAGVAASVGGQAVTSSRALKSDAGGAEADVLTLGLMTVQIIERQGRLAARVKDKNSAVLRAFKGMTYFPIDPAYRVVARFTPHARPQAISVPSVLGHAEDLPSPGTVTFDLGGKTYRLDPVIETPGDTQLFFIFRDQTAGKTTYGAGRFLYADLPRDLSKPSPLVLDFNKAYTPPCAFTPYATCPLPPSQNRLATPIQAGERFEAHAAHPGLR